MALKKDLPPRKNVKGGKIAINDNLTLVRVNEHTTREDTMANENITLIRAAKPARDLPVIKDVKGGKKKGGKKK